MNDSESDHESRWEDHFVNRRIREAALEAVVEEQARRIQELQAALRLTTHQAPVAQECRLRALPVATAKAAESLAAADQVSGGLLQEARRHH